MFETKVLPILSCFFNPLTAIFSNEEKGNDVNAGNELRTELNLKSQERAVLDRIHQRQKEDLKGHTGYFVMDGVVYKVFSHNTQVKKITGDEAKLVKRHLKKTFGL